VKRAVTALALALAACTSVGSGNQVSPQPPPSALAVVVDPTPNASNVHSVYLVDLDGHVVAHATAATKEAIYDITSKTSATFPFDGILVARIPGGL
jgi:hypothetical protein